MDTSPLPIGLFGAALFRGPHDLGKLTVKVSRPGAPMTNIPLEVVSPSFIWRNDTPAFLWALAKLNAAKTKSDKISSLFIAQTILYVTLCHL
jgi:hypothetical protein